MSRSARGRGGFSFNEGDWTCTGCSNVNFARRVECNRCGEQRKPGVKRIKKGGIQIGKAAAEKSRGLFSADDWICKTCGNVNWARRSDCNMCNAPKVGIQDERTGLGGGFNERQNVEYNKREDSDDEYDQYGRKKRRRSQNTPAQPVKKEPPPPESDDDEDEEESGDEEDLSKYDLEDDDDDDDVDASKYDLDASDDNKSRSRSRSRSSSSSRSRSPSRKRHYSSSSDESHKKYNHKKHRRSRSRSPPSSRHRYRD